jgi:ABC-type polysaccharide/polyol phosphate transport system ATPase subunit
MTVASSNSSKVEAESASKITAAVVSAAPHDDAMVTQLPLVELRDVGVWYELQSKKNSMKQSLLTGRLRAKPRVLWALRNINVICLRGQVIGVVGHNGAGKSTLCLVLARILAADEGTATIRGKTTPLFGLGTGFNNQISGRANIYLYAAFLGIPRREVDRKVADIIAFSELGDFIDEPIYTYSTGMRARLGFSVAAILEPEILILDEVFSVGDRQFRAKSRNRINQMMKRSKLIFIVSHSTGFLRKTCTHVLWLDHGQQKMFGKVDDVLDAYENATGGAKPGENFDPED